jgi:membrane fusion protein (multidrug efflux system)
LRSASGATASPESALAGAPFPASFFFDPDSARLTADARAAIAVVAAHLKQNPEARVHVTGYADKTGTRARNIELARKRAKAVHLALREEGVGDHQLNLKPPADVTGGPDDPQARRVDLHPALPADASSTPRSGR